MNLLTHTKLILIRQQQQQPVTVRFSFFEFAQKLHHVDSHPISYFKRFYRTVRVNIYVETNVIRSDPEKKYCSFTENSGYNGWRQTLRWPRISFHNTNRLVHFAHMITYYSNVFVLLSIFFAFLHSNISCVACNNSKFICIMSCGSVFRQI